MQPNLALYIHWPFCESKCPYCDFNSHVADAVDYDRWQQAYQKELSFFKEKMGNRTIDTIFFGGGTPSLMPPKLAGFLIDEAAKQFSLTDDCEITLEANPSSVEQSKFADLAEAGVNRVSLGVQSLRQKDLEFLGRRHNLEEALKGIEVAKNVFDRMSFDLIYARPKQTLKDWEVELKEALQLADGHMSLYQLTIEKGTPFYQAHQKGEFVVPEEELAADMYDLTNQLMEAEAYHAYEVSNYAQKGQESRHNLHYWHYDEYIGIGPGAHSRVVFNGNSYETRTALMMRHAPETWLKEVEASGAGIQSQDHLSIEDSLYEHLMMGLRITEGVDVSKLSDQQKAAFKACVDEAKLELFQQEGLLKYTDNNIRLTEQGRLLLNQIMNAIWK